MGKHDDTRPMKRLPDSPPRISQRLRFPILCVLAIDLALAALLAVVLSTPLSANYPGVPVQSPRTSVSPTLETVSLPTSSTAPSKTPVTARQTRPATHPHTTDPKPPVVPSSPAKSPTAPTPTVTATKTTSTPDPTD